MNKIFTKQKHFFFFFKLTMLQREITNLIFLSCNKININDIIMK